MPSEPPSTAVEAQLAGIRKFVNSLRVVKAEHQRPEILEDSDPAVQTVRATHDEMMAELQPLGFVSLGSTGDKLKDGRTIVSRCFAHEDATICGFLGVVSSKYGPVGVFCLASELSTPAYCTSQRGGADRSLARPPLQNEAYYPVTLGLAEMVRGHRQRLLSLTRADARISPITTLVELIDLLERLHQAQLEWRTSCDPDELLRADLRSALKRSARTLAPEDFRRMYGRAAEWLDLRLEAHPGRAILDEVEAERKHRTEAHNGELPAEQEKDLTAWAIERYTEAIRVAPDFPEAHLARGMAFFLEGRREDAQKDMRNAFALGPREPRMYLGMSFPFEDEEQRRMLQGGLARTENASADHHLLQGLVIRSYWQEGNFQEFVRLKEHQLGQLDPESPSRPDQLGDVARGYSALGEHARAEEAYRGALSEARGRARESAAEGVLRTYLHRERYAEGRQVVRELAMALPDKQRVVWEAVFQVLIDPESAQTRLTAEAAVAAAETLQLPAGHGKDHTNYNAFLLGVIYKGAGRLSSARQLLTTFASRSEANPRDQGVTMRWEIATARALLE